MTVPIIEYSRPPNHSTGRSGWVLLGIVCAIVLLASLIVAPMFEHLQDVYGCWLNWAKITNGNRPWNLYLSKADTFNRPLDCNYPPFTLYLLTAVQWTLNALPLPQFGAGAVTVVKTPGIICLMAGGWVCYPGLGKLHGRRIAAHAAILYVLCLPVWFNAAVWGQWDAVLCLAMICAIIAVLNDRPVLAGISIGWALSVKLQAVVLIPAVAVYAIRNWRIAKTAAMLMSAIAAWGLIAAPFFFAGAGHGVWNSYFGAVNHYPLRSVCACNVWMIGDTWSKSARDWSFPFGWRDDQPLVWGITAKQIGLSLFAVYVQLLMVILCLRPTAMTFVQTAGMTAFAFFMLPTQMHERYIIPVCAIFSITAVRGDLRLYLALLGSAAVSQVAALVYENEVARNAMNLPRQTSFQFLFLSLSILNAIIFLTATVQTIRILSTTRAGPAVCKRSISA